MPPFIKLISYYQGVFQVVFLFPFEATEIKKQPETPPDLSRYIDNLYKL